MRVKNPQKINKIKFIKPKKNNYSEMRVTNPKIKSSEMGHAKP
jgi:hypothetical protein